MPFLGNIGPGELILLLVIILVIFGPGRLPEIGNAVGKGIREFRKAASDVTEATKIDAQPEAPAPPPAPVSTSTSAEPLSPAGEDERRRYEELKARFEPAPSSAAKADESHGDAGHSAA